MESLIWLPVVFSLSLAFQQCLLRVTAKEGGLVWPVIQFAQLAWHAIHPQATRIIKCRGLHQHVEHAMQCHPCD